MSRCLIGLDVGTTGCKAVVFSSDGSILGQGFKEYDVVCSEPGMAEQDAEQVWQLSLQALQEAVAKANIRQAVALSISVQGDAIFPVDGSLKPLAPAILGMDYRSNAQARWCDEKLGGYELFKKTGMRPHPMNSVVKAIWLRDQRPATFAKARRIVTYADFILGRLGGEAWIDYTMASRTMGFNLENLSWSSELLGQMGLEAGLFSRAVPSGTPAGTLAKDIASRLGLVPGTLLVTGGHDQVCAAVGSGVIDEGLGVISTGTAEVFSTAFHQPALSTKMFESFYPCYLHAKKGMYFTFALNHVGGILLKWFKDQFAQAEVAEAAAKGLDVYRMIDERMPIGLSPLMVLPHFNGSGTPMCDVSARGAIVGWTMASTRHDLAKAILEGLSFELLINLNTMLRCGLRVDELVAAGGGSKSSHWVQLKADILNRPIHTLKCREAACLGAALLAGTAAGLYASLDDAVKATVAVDREYLPQPELAKRYAERFQVYEQLYPAVRRINMSL